MLEWLPFLLLILCPLMMFFMIQGMHNHKKDDHDHKDREGS